MDKMLNTLRPYLSRILAALIASLSGWLATHVGIEVSTETRDALVQVGIFIMFLLYGVVHKFIDSKVNPTDAAGVGIANRTKAAHDAGHI